MSAVASFITRFTVREYSKVLRVSSQYLRKVLKHVAPAIEKKIPRRQTKRGGWIITGKPADAWEIASLPSPLIQRLARLAQKLGCSSPLELMLNPPTATVSSLARVSHVKIERAQKLQRAFAACLAFPAETSTSERARIAAPHYKREFGNEVSDRYLRKLIDHILEKDAGAQNFADLRLYTPSSDTPKQTRRCAVSGRFDLRELDDQFREISKRATPTLKDKAFCWRKIVAFYKARLGSGANAVALKRQLREYVLSVLPFLSDSPDAIKRNLNRKLRDEAELGIAALVDGRVEPRKSEATERLVERFNDDLKLLAQHACFYCGGRVSQAYRELHDGRCHNGERFSEDFREAFSFNCRKAKSRVPKIVRSVVAPMVKAMAPLRLGPRAAKLALPSIHRDWSRVISGATYTSDDQTLNEDMIHYCEWGAYEDPDGRRFNLGQPQFLPLVCERTDLPLAFCLIPAKAYNSWHIRTLIKRACMRPEIGLPFEGFVFEQGIWRARNVEAIVKWTDIDRGFDRYNLTLRHATTPKAKIVERVIGALQNLDEWTPAYAGRNRQRVKYERVEKFRMQLKRVDQPRKAPVNPREIFMTIEECEEKLAGVLRRFADEPQNGERLEGLSPEEAWAQLSGGRPHVVLPEVLQHLLGSAQSVKTVTSEGIMLPIGRLKHYYTGSDRLGELIGEKVCARYDPELPEIITVAHITSDPHGLNPFSVPLFERVPAHGATAEQFTAAREHQNRFASYGRALYRELAPKTNTTICHSGIGSPELRAAGEAHNRLQREQIELTAGRDANRGAIRQLAAKHRLAIDPQRSKRPDRVLKHLESMERRSARLDTIESAIAKKDEAK